MAITHKQYMADSSNLHNQYFGQMVTPSIVNLVSQFIGKDRIVASTNPYFNDIPLCEWDRLAPMVRSTHAAFVRQHDPEWLRMGTSLSDCVCILKAAARQIKSDATRV